ncbi:MAG: hypothetical protein AAGC54_10335 [Cyanobacteria bacterium P01_F01_bin.4]
MDRLPPKPSQQTLWLVLSLLFAVLYGFLFWRKAFAGDYSLQDDARQHIFWMQRWLDPDLFPDDLIADYFQSLAPFGYKTLYKTAASVGIHPFLLSKLLPPILSIVATIYGFFVCLKILPSPVVAFVSTLLLNQSMWMWRDLGSGTPRSFAIPILLAFLYYLARRALWPCVGVILLAGWFYPHLVLVSVATLAIRLLRYEHGQVRLSDAPSDYRLLGWGAAAGILVLLPFVVSASPYGPVISAAQAKTMPEFGAGGRQPFFGKTGIDYWLGGKSGLFSMLNPATLYTGFCLPLLLPFRKRLPMLLKTTPALGLLAQLAGASLVLFGIAHALLFKLHAPNRYTNYSASLILSMAAAIVLISLADAVGKWIWPAWSKGVVAGVVIGLMLYPASLNSFLDVLYLAPTQGPLYEFLAQQPKDTLVASLSEEADNISTFARRSVLVSQEHSIAYHTGYYDQIRQRVIDLLYAQTSPDLGELQRVIQQYGIDLWLVDGGAFNPEFMAQSKWLQQFKPAVDDAIATLKQAPPPALRQLMPNCTLFQDGDIALIKAACLLSQPKF